MSRLLSLAGSPPLPALEARSYSAYDGCYSLSTSTASAIYNLDQSDPPTCAATCGNEYQYVAIQAQFCFCFFLPPAVFTTYSDSDCSINCDLPYQEESCGGVTPGTLVDLYSFYAGSDIALPSYDGNDSSNSTASELAAPTSGQVDTSLEPTTTHKPSPVTPGPTAPVTIALASPAGTTMIDEGTSSGENTSDPGVESSAVPAPVPTIAAAPQPVSTYTINLWTTVTSYTTIYPGGPLLSTIFSLPTMTTCVTEELSSTSCSEIVITSTCDEDGSMVTSVPMGPAREGAYSPYVSEMTELMVEDTGEGASTEVVLAAVVPVETAAAGLGRRNLRSVPNDGVTAGNYTAETNSTMASLGLNSSGTGWVITATGGQISRASATPSQVPVTAGVDRADIGWKCRMMFVVVLAVILGHRV